MSKVDLSGYIDVAERIVEFRKKFPDGSLQPANLDKPYSIETINETTWIVVVAAAYRSPDDQRPGIGMAYEPFPGRTMFTKGSELQNAETSAWGRAIVAALAADTSRGIASHEEVRNRKTEQQRDNRPQQMPALPDNLDEVLADLERGLDKQSAIDLYNAAKAREKAGDQAAAGIAQQIATVGERISEALKQQENDHA